MSSELPTLGDNHLGSGSVAALHKLTVAQLKAICKDRKITGYSKLGKPALVEKLVASGYSASELDQATLIPLPPPSKGAPVSAPSILNTPDGPSHVTGHVSGSQLGVTVENTKDRPQTKKARPRQPKAKKPRVHATPSHTENVLSVLDDTRQTNHTSGPATTAVVTIAQSTSATESGFVTPASPSYSLAAVPSSTISLPGKSPHIGLTQSKCSYGNDRSVPRVAVPSPATRVPSPSSSASATETASKRPAQNLYVISSKRQKVAHIPSTVVPVTSPLLHSAFKTSTLQATGQSVVSISSSTGQDQLLLSAHSRAVPEHIEPTQKAPSGNRATAAKRFKPLVVKKPQDIQVAVVGGSAPTTLTSLIPSSSQVYHQRALFYLDFPLTARPPDLVPITLPPSLSQRKRVHRWAVILSGISNEERRHCALVSRMFRYAVYLSAAQILNQRFDGRRLKDDVAARYSQAMTNMWPYLRQREDEALRRRRVFDESFVGQFFKSQELSNPISHTLWVSPDNERQIVMAIRFVMTSLWFTISIGSYANRKNPFHWLGGTIVGAQEIVKGELCTITVCHQISGTRSIRQQTFYVLEPTCEVVGHPPASHSGNQDNDSASMWLRADWSHYIQQRVTADTSTSLLAHVRWLNHEEYIRGVSKLWLTRVGKEGELGQAKRTIAERYVLACVVGNSVSGQWMSTTEMAQNFAGLPSRIGNVPSKAKMQGVNLFLPEHHYVESVHFATSKGEALHPALAVVQTPQREYFILRDNGMQVGCEEDGVAAVWQNILRCDYRGL